MTRRMREISSTERRASVANAVLTFDAFCDGHASLAALKRSFRTAEASGNTTTEVVDAICCRQAAAPEAEVGSVESDVVVESAPKR